VTAWRAALGRSLGGAATVAVLVGAWQAWISWWDVERIVAPPPRAVWDDVSAHPGLYLDALWPTVWLATIGLLAGLALGTTLAVLAWRSEVLAGLVTPTAVLVNAIPIVALIPVVARILGYQGRTVVAVCVLMSFFTTFVFVGSGLRDVPAGSPELFAAFGATPRGRLRHLALPAAVPSILVALRIGSTSAVIIAVVAESLMGTTGLGRLFSRSYQRLEMDRAWGVALLVIVVSLLAFTATGRLERWARTRWS
jgi:ABC-type nitrate/sulfonate/bicarbonate transport system permease component